MEAQIESNYSHSLHQWKWSENRMKVKSGAFTVTSFFELISNNFKFWTGLKYRPGYSDFSYLIYFVIWTKSCENLENFSKCHQKLQIFFMNRNCLNFFRNLQKINEKFEIFHKIILVCISKIRILGSSPTLQSPDPDFLIPIQIFGRDSDLVQSYFISNEFFCSFFSSFHRWQHWSQLVWRCLLKIYF